ncbi:hypothetical protein BJ170DRAFT_592315 [Xylariales sp. AK1849]|nr:hypothetical protein BJ170DRAFT_592315 [Xylariales sp. AK1849]
MVSSKAFTGAVLALANICAAVNSPCPFNYPTDLNNTESGNGLVFTAITNNPLTNNRAVQLRPNPFLPGAFFVGIDNSSSVLLGNLRDAGLYSQARSMLNQLYDLGPTAYLNQRDVVGTTTRYTVGFANATQWPGEVDQGWYLLAPSEQGEYGLYHDVAGGVSNGFLLCEADTDVEDGAWYQLFYNEYAGSPTDIDGCEYIGVRTAVGASILNGNCDIGGVVATE